jgi:thymidylate synthase ThyX
MARHVATDTSVEMKFRVNILADSIPSIYSHLGPYHPTRLLTFAIQAPRPILAEWNTHRAFSRSAESSRARPIESVLEMVRTNPYLPGDLPDGELMGNNPKMQAKTPLTKEQKIGGRACMASAARAAVDWAVAAMRYGFHKQDVNRLVEPFGWTRIVASSNLPGLYNFFAQRTDDHPYPPFRFLARSIAVAIKRSSPRSLQPGEWHLPFITRDDRKHAAVLAEESTEATPPGFRTLASYYLARWSAARCCRVSYYHFGSKEKCVNYDKDNETYHNLITAKPIHSAPFEQQAFWVNNYKDHPASNFVAPWVQFRKLIPGETHTQFDWSHTDSWNIPDDVFDPID